jgi:hypothetical protein
MPNARAEAAVIPAGQAPSAYRRALTAILVERRLPYNVAIRLKKAYYVRALATVAFRLVRWTPSVDSTADSNIDVITLLDRANVDAYLIAVKSFLCRSGLKARVTVLSDGSLTPAQLGLLARHVRGVRIIDSAKGKVNAPGFPERLQEIYRDHVHVRKALALPLDDLKDTILLMDSDVVFRQKVDPDFTDLSQVDLKYNRDHDHSTHDPYFHLAESFMDGLSLKQHVRNLNSGLVVFRRQVLNVDIVARFLLYLDGQDRLHPVMEQDCYALLASTVRAVPLPDSYWVGCNPDHAGDKATGRRAIAKHYVGGVRYINCDYVRDGISAMLQMWRRVGQA